MKKMLVYVSGLFILISLLHGQLIIRTSIKGVGFQTVNSNSPIIAFNTSGPDINGYIYLSAITQDGREYQFFRSKWKGTSVQSFNPPSGHYIVEFKARGPDDSGFVTLTVFTNEGDSGDIIKSRWNTLGFQNYRFPANYVLSGFSVIDQYPYKVLECNSIQVPVSEDFEHYSLNLCKISPNPTNGKISVELNIPKNTKVAITLFSIDGREYGNLYIGELQAGVHRLNFNLSTCKIPLNGIYMLKIRTNDMGWTKKIIILK